MPPRTLPNLVRMHFVLGAAIRLIVRDRDLDNEGAYNALTNAEAWLTLKSTGADEQLVRLSTDPALGGGITIGGVGDVDMTILVSAETTSTWSEAIRQIWGDLLVKPAGGVVEHWVRLELDAIPSTTRAR